MLFCYIDEWKASWISPILTKDADTQYIEHVLKQSP